MILNEKQIQSYGVNFSFSSWCCCCIGFYLLGLSGENMSKWIVTLILSIAFVVLGIIGIINYKSNKLITIYHSGVEYD